MLKVKEIMSTDLITMTVENNVAQAREVMAEHNVRHLLIIDKNKQLLGIVTQRDILRAQSSSLVSSEDIHVGKIGLSEVMSDKLISVHPEDSLRGAGKTMQKRKLGCLPVVDNDKLMGIITDSDFVGVAINLIEEQDYVEDQAADFDNDVIDDGDF